MFGSKKHADVNQDQGQAQDHPVPQQHQNVDGILPAHTQTGPHAGVPQHTHITQGMPAVPPPMGPEDGFIMTEAPVSISSGPMPATNLHVATPAYPGDSIPVSVTPAPAPLPPAPAPEPLHVAAPEPTPEPTPAPVYDNPSDDLLALKQTALQQLAPLVGHLDQSPEDKFRTTMMMLQSTDDQSLVRVAYEAAQSISNEKHRAQALLDVVNEINYFTQKNANNAGN